MRVHKRAPRGHPRSGRGWPSGSGGGGEREPRACFGEAKGEVEKGRVDDRIERLRTLDGSGRGRLLTYRARRDLNPRPPG